MKIQKVTVAETDVEVVVSTTDGQSIAFRYPGRVEGSMRVEQDGHMTIGIQVTPASESRARHSSNAAR